MKLRYLAIAMMAYAGPVFASGNDSEIGVVSGEWASARHMPDDGSSADMCFAVTKQVILFGIKVDKETIQIRVSDEDWNMPRGAVGSMKVVSGKYSHDFILKRISSDTLNGNINTDAAKELIESLAKSEKATLSFNNKTFVSIELSGSIRVFNDFLGCARRNDLADLGDTVGQTNSPF